MRFDTHARACADGTRTFRFGGSYSVVYHCAYVRNTRSSSPTFPLEREPPGEHCIIAVERSRCAGRNNSLWVVKCFNLFFFFGKGRWKNSCASRYAIIFYSIGTGPCCRIVSFFGTLFLFPFFFLCFGFDGYEESKRKRERERNTVTFWIYFKVTLLR